MKLKRTTRRVLFIAVPLLALALVAGLLTAAGDDNDPDTGAAVGPAGHASTTSAEPATSTTELGPTSTTNAPTATPGANNRALAPATTLVPYAGSRGIAFSVGEAIYVMNPDGTGRTRVAADYSSEEHPGPNSLSGPTWHPDATHLLFSSNNKYGGWFETIRADGSGRRTLVSGYHVSAADYSPDGRRIVYGKSGFYGSDGRLHVMSANASGDRVVSDGPNDLEPTWSPDNHQIAYQSRDPDPAPHGTSSIRLLNVDTGAERVLPTGGGAWSPAWSPNGRRIAFVSSRDGQNELYVVDVDGSDLQRLTINAAMDEAPAWSPDGRQLVFGRGVFIDDARSGGRSEFDIWTLDIGSGRETRLTDLPGYEFDPAWG